MKEQIKHILGFMRCKIFGIPIELNSQVYIGKGVKVRGGNRIHLDNGTVIRPNVSLWCSGRGIEIGRGSEIGERSRISIANMLKIGNKVLVSPNVYITDCDHEYSQIGVPIIDQGTVKKDYQVVIGDHAYIGINSVIVGNISIGKGSVIGANSVVTKSIPDYCVAVGAPAKIIKKYNAQNNKWEHV
ncbi:MAG: acyltransferase [Lachnospiraceae bacterium]|nr:acyltransferase [Lachnospiraceae bacterium]